MLELLVGAGVTKGVTLKIAYVRGDEPRVFVGTLESVFMSGRGDVCLSLKTRPRHGKPPRYCTFNPALGTMRGVEVLGG